MSYQVCAALRKMTSVLRLGVYRERIEKYSGANGSSSCNGRNNNQQGTVIKQAHPLPPAGCSGAAPSGGSNMRQSRRESNEEMLTVTIERQAGKHLGIRLTGQLEQSSSGIFIADIQEGSAIAQDGRLQKHDRILFINGQDVREAVDLSQASALIQVTKPWLLLSRQRVINSMRGWTMLATKSVIFLCRTTIN